ncbi:hypothetical protein Tco_1019028 [Tanacetum coccineum]|uniref:RNA-directed DNA polymerase, eukaryota, reverse transcriptase zinc-binding domain protein n=1 Tax=Tanacetum coccineum TaxID=301880 RepID=A0ABQ5FXC1_9ASTR
MRWECEAESRALNEDELKEWMKARKIWIEKDGKKASILRQKARVKWDVEGDENSKSKQNQRRTIRYYKKIFSRIRQDRPKFGSNRVNKLSEDEARGLENMFSEKEIREAVMACGCDKAPGPDGFNFRFLKWF